MKLFAEQVLLADGWQQNKTLTIIDGKITAIESGHDDNASQAAGPVIPGMVNCHSHAFQRAFAGFSEQSSGNKDSFWTWRQVMYQFLARLSVADAQAIATQLYIEMLKAGYTRVAEFHYLHHDIDGSPYKQLSAMANGIFNAAAQAGIGLTLLPVLYQYSSFGQAAPTEGQRRFINTTEQFNRLVSECHQLTKSFKNSNIGIAPHSLRATDKAAMTSALDHVKAIDAQAPVHIHISEQMQEVNDCLHHTGKRPVQWLLNQMPVDSSWCLIHATHIDQTELAGIAQSGAVAGICPTTEANLGDGVFPTADFMQAGGKVAIGSDSHISVNAIEELRWLEYAQRLTRQQRAVLVGEQQASVGLQLWQHTARAGAQSTNWANGQLAIGQQADLVVLDKQQLACYANQPNTLMDSVVFATRQSVVRDVMVNGQWQIINGQHALEHEAAQALALLIQQQQSK